MDELLTYTEGDSDTASSSPISSGVVISEGPVLIGPISIPKVEENATESDGGGVQGEGSSDASPQHTPEAIDTHGTIAVGDVTSLELDSGEATKLSASTADTDGEDPKGTPTAETDQSSSQSEPREADNAQDTPAEEAGKDDNDAYAAFVDDFWSPVQYNEHDSSARIVRTGSIILGGVALAVTAIALVLPVFGVPEGTTLAGIPVTTQEDGPKAVQTLQQQLDQTAFSLTNKRGETVTKSGAELGLKVDETNTTKGLNSWINRSGVWVKRLTGKVTLPVEISGGNSEVLTETAKAITLGIKEPEVVLTATGAQSTPGVDGYETDTEMLVAGLTDTIRTVTSQPGDWKAAPVEVVTTGRTMKPHISAEDVDAVTAQWNHVLNTPVTLTKAANQPAPATTTSPSPGDASSSASASATSSPSASAGASASSRASGSPSAESSGSANASATPKGAATARPSADASTASVAPLQAQAARVPTIQPVFMSGKTLVSQVIAQADTPSADAPTSPTPEGEAGSGPTIKVEEGEGESKAGEQNIQDEQTPQVTDQAGGDVVLSKEDKLAITQVVQDTNAEPGARLKLDIKGDALPESLTNFFAANTVTKGLKAHIEGEQNPPKKAAASDKSLHDVSHVSGKVVVDSMADGFVPDESATLKALLTAAQGGGGTVPLIGLEDKVSSPESLGIKEPVSTFTSFFSPGQSRVKNIHRIADLVDGVVVGPGQSFELNKHVGRRTRKNGFTDGGAIQEGQMVSEVGGGVSQFATTFYNAAWFSGVLIPQHKAHSQYFNRYPAGREATLNYPGVNLEIINDTPYAILIDTSHTSSSVTVTFWSTKYWEVESERGKCLCVPHAAFPVTWTRTRTNPEGKSEKWTVTTYYQSPRPKKKDN